ncbi:L,D-transpeptidase family protein [Sporomusa sp.]|uniref:L,D-transpeptidase family protein n=1 Tax=Sporomusa sp. TaxID=2078658 RepID=UPI002B9B4729|nr:L,D-transpeptidase family protein [Sporomusa sp.]HWR43751.1 L,D-transpeptidase family protein [Sporomusa sp.]
MLHRILICFYVFLFLTVSVGYAQSELVTPSITVNLPSRTIELFSGNNLVKEYPIAIGKPSTPTPLGNFSIIYKEVNPAWYPPDQKGKIVPSGPENPLGYRWMGIWSDYGIHGTNAPWSIGKVVSNGCIRMYEEDVEELFDKVSYGTPVQITYDRIKVRTNAKRQILLAIYPDVYGYGSVTVTDIRNKLNAYRLNPLVTDDFLRKLLSEANGSQVVIASQFRVKVNARLINEPGLVVQDVQYVPVHPIAEALKQKINWDEKTKTVQCGSSSVPGMSSGNMVYVAAANIRTLFGGELSWNAAEDTLSLGKLVVFINEKPVNLEINMVQGILAVPVLDLAETMGRKVKWNKETQVLVVTDKGQSSKVPVDMIGTVPYIKITNINQYFDAYVYWNEQAKTIELTYP